MPKVDDKSIIPTAFINQKNLTICDLKRVGLRPGAVRLHTCSQKQGVAMLSGHEDLRRKIDLMGKRYEAGFPVVFESIRQMLEARIPASKTIAFHAPIGVAGKNWREWSK